MLSWAVSLSKTAVLRATTTTTTASTTAVVWKQPRCFFSSIRTGTVKWFDVSKGFGFIVPDGDDGHPDIFVHHTAVHADGFRSLCEGEHVEFTTMVDERGRVRADRVTGPLGSFVQGAPRAYPPTSRSNYPNSSSGGGSSRSGFGDSSGGSGDDFDFGFYEGSPRAADRDSTTDEPFANVDPGDRVMSDNDFEPSSEPQQEREEDKTMDAK